MRRDSELPHKDSQAILLLSISCNQYWTVNFIHLTAGNTDDDDEVAERMHQRGMPIVSIQVNNDLHATRQYAFRSENGHE